MTKEMIKSRVDWASKAELIRFLRQKQRQGFEPRDMLCTLTRALRSRNSDLIAAVRVFIKEYLFPR